MKLKLIPMQLGLFDITTFDFIFIGVEKTRTLNNVLGSCSGVASYRELVWPIAVGSLLFFHLATTTSFHICKEGKQERNFLHVPLHDWNGFTLNWSELYFKRTIAQIVL